jgi:hypothetical protein
MHGCTLSPIVPAGIIAGAPLTRRLFLSLTAALAPGAAIAHHGWGGYDTSKSFTVTGEILKSTYENCEIEMEVDRKPWRFVLAPPSRMQRRGITPDIIAPGKTCVLAVCALMTSSNLVGCATGRSAGFAPLRMRPV